MAEEQVILVNADDRETGAMEKLAAHRNGGARHRAFSVFIVDPRGRWLLQRRAAFQKAVALWRDGQNKAARAEIAPFPASLKFRLFHLATYLPGACFDGLARAYYALPRFLRK